MHGRGPVHSDVAWTVCKAHTRGSAVIHLAMTRLLHNGTATQEFSVGGIVVICGATA